MGFGEPDDLTIRFLPVQYMLIQQIVNCL